MYDAVLCLVYFGLVIYDFKVTLLATIVYSTPAMFMIIWSKIVWIGKKAELTA